MKFACILASRARLRLPELLYRVISYCRIVFLGPLVTEQTSDIFPSYPDIFTDSPWRMTKYFPIQPAYFSVKVSAWTRCFSDKKKIGRPRVAYNITKPYYTGWIHWYFYNYVPIKCIFGCLREIGFVVRNNVSGLFALL